MAAMGGTVSDGLGQGASDSMAAVWRNIAQGLKLAGLSTKMIYSTLVENSAVGSAPVKMIIEHGRSSTHVGFIFATMPQRLRKPPHNFIGPGCIYLKRAYHI